MPRAGGPGLSHGLLLRKDSPSSPSLSPLPSASPSGLPAARRVYFRFPESWPTAIPDQLQSSPGPLAQLLFAFSVLPAITFSGFHFKHFVLFLIQPALDFPWLKNNIRKVHCLKEEKKSCGEKRSCVQAEGHECGLMMMGYQALPCW